MRNFIFLITVTAMFMLLHSCQTVEEHIGWNDNVELESSNWSGNLYLSDSDNQEFIEDMNSIDTLLENDKNSSSNSSRKYTL